MAPLRSAARRRYDGEPSVVLVDGPVRFASGWDEWATDILQLADADRPVIDLAVSTSATEHDAAVDSPTDTEPEQAVRRGLVDVVAPGRLCADTPIDDEDHDGSRLALRAYTHGYDCFATDAVLVWKPGAARRRHRGGPGERRSVAIRTDRRARRAPHRRRVPSAPRLVGVRGRRGLNGTAAARRRRVRRRIRVCYASPLRFDRRRSSHESDTTPRIDRAGSVR